MPPSRNHRTPRHSNPSRIRFAAVVLCVLGCATSRVSRQDLDAAELALPDLDGKLRRLSEFRGRVVLLDFWATWCEPCRAYLSVYNSLQLEHGRDRLVVLAASVDGEDAPVEDFIRRHAPDVVALRDSDGAAAARFGLTVLPTAYLFDRDGRLVRAYRSAREDDLDALRTEIARLLQQVH